MYQNIPMSLLDESLTSEALAMTAERRAAIQDEINAWERYSKPSLRQFGGSESVASMGQGQLGQASASVTVQHDNGRIRRSSYVMPRNMRSVPKNMKTYEAHQPLVRFEENLSPQMKMSSTQRSVSRPDFVAMSSSISASNYDNHEMLFGRPPADRPLLPASVAKPFPGFDRFRGGDPVGRSVFYDRYAGGYCVGHSEFYLPAQIPIDFKLSLTPLEGDLRPSPGQNFTLPSLLFKNVGFNLPIAAVLEKHIRK